jgi:hypothetical protein
VTKRTRVSKQIAWARERMFEAERTGRHDESTKWLGYILALEWANRRLFPQYGLQRKPEALVSA